MDHDQLKHWATLLAVYLATLSLKLLLLRAPYSTDLEVHRHWKSLTYHKPIKAWYTDESSIWTLDYPPLFAYFEYLLSSVITPFHPTLTALNHSTTTHTTTEVTIMRITLLVCEPILLYAIYKLAKIVRQPSAHLRSLLLSILLPGITLVDNIHFQYNALPLSFLLLTLYHLSKKNLHLSTILFSLSINLKQTLLPLSPIIASYLVANLYHAPKTIQQKLLNLSTLAITTIIPLVLPWVPFIHNATYKQAFVRLFPLHRGLLHANWAPNFWALYAAIDRLLCLAFAMSPTDISPTKGIINNMRPFVVLPDPTPPLCIALTLIFTAPFIFSLFQTPTPNNLLIVTAAAALSSFLFGWHVHEKAVLVSLLPLALSDQYQAFIWLSLGGQFALLELLRNPAIAPFLIAHFVAFHAALFSFYGVSAAATMYFVGCLILEVYAGVLGGHRIVFGTRMEFLPIMLVSLYSFIGVAIAYVKLIQRILVREKTD